MNDLEQPEAREKLEFDIALADLALHLDPQAEDDGKEHEEDGEENGRKDTLDDTEHGPGCQLLESRYPLTWG